VNSTPPISRRRRVAPALALGAVVAAAPGYADFVQLADGKIIEGEVKDCGESYDVKTKYGTLTVRKTDVKRIAKGNEAASIADPPLPPPAPVIAAPPELAPLPPVSAPKPAAPLLPVRAPSSDLQRTPPPPEGAQRQSEALIRSLFKEEYARRTPRDLSALAERLIRDGAATQDDPTARFVLFREARDLAARAGDARVAMNAVEAMAKFYAIDAAGEKLAVLEKLDGSARTPAGARALADICLRAMDEAAANERYDTAARLGRKGETAARAAKDHALVARIQKRLLDVQEAQKEASALAAHRRAIEADPADPAANAGLGRHFCFVRWEWEKGLPLLAKGADPALKALASAELENPADAAGRVALGDAWWDAGEILAGPARRPYLERAVAWYGAAAQHATGLVLTKIKIRIADYAKLYPHPPARPLRPTTPPPAAEPR
jgi:hypothetical protein